MPFAGMDLPTAEDVKAGARLFVNTFRVLRTSSDPDEGRGRLQERLERRETNFLALAGETIYANPESPYLRLLDLAGCEYGDLERLVEDDGLEGTLQLLYRRGVYLTVDESKGRVPVIRGSSRFEIDPSRLHNPRIVPDMVAHTSGSRGTQTSVPAQLSRENRIPELDEARGRYDRVLARWAVPGSNTLGSLVRDGMRGTETARWFTPVDPSHANLHPRYLWSARAVRWAARLAGVRIPHPEFVPLSDPAPIVRWMVEVLGTGRKPGLHTYVTPAVKVCQAAYEAGIRLDGAHFHITGEPATAARLAAIHRVGATATTHYASTEVSSIGAGCLAPDPLDEVHFRADCVGLVQPGAHAMSNLPRQALLVTSLLPGTKLILVNVSTGDEAEVVQRDCGCPLEALGLKTHLHTIRSFEKLTAGGMTFFDADVIRALEVVLPARFGGGPTDYQLVDEDTDSGAPSVRLLVQPRLGPLDSEQVRRVFLDAIGGGSGADRVMGLVWNDAGWPVVVREAPRVTPGGKIQHVHRVSK